MVLGHVIEAAAITLVFVRGSIFKRVREAGPSVWRELAGCPLCAGVWVGAAWHLLRERPLAVSIDVIADVLGVGALTGVLALVVVLLVSLLDRWS